MLLNIPAAWNHVLGRRTIKIQQDMKLWPRTHGLGNKYRKVFRSLENSRFEKAIPQWKDNTVFTKIITQSLYESIMHNIRKGPVYFGKLCKQGVSYCWKLTVCFLCNYYVWSCIFPLQHCFSDPWTYLQTHCAAMNLIPHRWCRHMDRE